MFVEDFSSVKDQHDKASDLSQIASLQALVDIKSMQYQYAKKIMESQTISKLLEEANAFAAKYQKPILKRSVSDICDNDIIQSSNQGKMQSNRASVFSSSSNPRKRKHHEDSDSESEDVVFIQKPITKLVGPNITVEGFIHEPKAQKGRMLYLIYSVDNVLFNGYKALFRINASNPP